MYNQLTLGLTREKIKESIKDELDKNADLLIGIDDPEVQEMINVLVDSFSKAIEQNNEEIANDIETYLKKLLS
jgi:hypothetical protein